MYCLQESNIRNGVNILAQGLDSVISEYNNVYDARVLSKALLNAQYQAPESVISFDEYGAASLPMSLFNIKPILGWSPVGHFNTSAQKFESNVDDILWIKGKGQPPGDGLTKRPGERVCMHVLTNTSMHVRCAT